ncbi:hypothetical protein DSL72_006274 [Monilinia vaccinii-corymbosi]|uniref:Uncharacterized protein n=1 Tax=Monilinia vaccinii-corymbosi TaxID=61207 RepID=A0A8A3PM10_9HELO|nr:hypothetical protein DSL72_006274 [Monilinia vaccinii-corymbosi]
MAGRKLRKEKSSTPNKRNNPELDSDSASHARNHNKQNEQTYDFQPDVVAMQRKDNEIHFLRLLSFASAIALLVLFAFHRYKTSQLEALLEAKEQQYIQVLAGGLVPAGEDTSVYSVMMDQCVSLIYVIAIVVGVITWW